MKCLLYSSDLMFSSQVSGAAGAAGVDVETVATPDRLLSRAAGVAGKYVALIDLTLPRLDIVALVQELRKMSNSPARILAVGPHVHEQKLAAAKQAGCDHILTRGEARRDLAALLAELAGDTPD